MVAATLPAQKQPISDDTIYDQVKRRLANDMDVRGGGLQVDVKQGVVTIRGNVETEKQKTKATKLVKKVKGVKSVNNELTVVLKGAK
jgi:osmotically-inducible protein OsmY